MPTPHSNTFATRVLVPCCLTLLVACGAVSPQSATQPQSANATPAPTSPSSAHAHGVGHSSPGPTESELNASGIGPHIPGNSRSDIDYIGLVSAAGDRNQQADELIRALNRIKGPNYANTLAAVSAKLDPVIVVQFDGVGGTFHLRDGKRKVTINPVPPAYELAKSVAHTALTIYTVFAPYARTPDAKGWKDELRKLVGPLNASLEHIDETSLVGDARTHARTVLTESKSFLDTTLQADTFSLAAYGAYTKRILPAIMALRHFATDLQVRSVVAMLERWRDELGPERWKQLAAAVIAPYTTASETPNLQCLRFVMHPDHVKDNLLMIGGDFGNDVDKAITVLGRVFMDRHLARSVFDATTKAGQKEIRSLSSRRDFMADTAQEILEQIAKERAKK